MKRAGILLLILALLALCACAQPPEPEQREPAEHIEQAKPADALARALAEQQEQLKTVEEAIETARLAENTGEKIAGTAADPDKLAQVLEKVAEPEKARQQAEQELFQAVASNGEFTFDPATGTISGYTGPGGDVMIPAKINGVAVKSIGEDAFMANMDITSVVIPEGVVNIGRSAFGECFQLTSVSLPGSLRSIGDSAFWRSSLTSINIPEGVESIGAGTFALCGGLTSIILPGSVKSIGDSAFNNCSGLADITLPPGLKSIGRNAFHACDSLTELVVPAGVESISTEAFSQCYNLTSVSIPASVKEIGGGMLLWSAQAVLIWDSANPYFVWEDGLLFNAARTELVYCSPQKSGSYHVPEGIEAIGLYAFVDCGQLTSVTLPQSVRSLGDYLFISSGVSELVFMGERPSFASAFAGAFALERIYYTDGASGWPDEPVTTEAGVITPEPRL